MDHDPVEAVIAAYLDHLETGAPEPSLDHLTGEDRSRAQEIIGLMADGRGIDVYRSAPSLNTLLTGTEFEDWLTAPDTAGLSLDRIRTDVISALGAASEPVADGAAENEGIRSDAVIRYGTLRIRVQFRDDIASAADLAHVEPRSAAGAVFGRFAGCPAVVVVIGDPELSSVAIDPFDTEEFIGTPDGQTYPPRITRPVLPLFNTLRALVDELAPDLAVDEVDDTQAPIELAEIITSACAAASAAVVTEGAKARTEAKKATWQSFDGQRILQDWVEAAAAGELGGSDLENRIDSAAAA